MDKPLVTALVQGKDRKGIIAGITNFIYKNNGNIVCLDQHTDPIEEMFFMRVQFKSSDFKIPWEKLNESFGAICQELGMSHRLYFSDQKKKVAIMVSKEGHCLLELLYRWKSKYLDIEIPVIVSNHEVQRNLAEYYGIPYYFLPISKNNKQAMEEKTLDIFAEYKVDTIVLARYMQILTKKFVDSYPNAIINIHHSFLPAFVGANPYLQAFHRGVKIIGATSHYVTEELDQGPIIAQDVIQVSHRYTVEDLKRKGQDIEKLVLSRAVSLHVENRILVHNGKTIIFGD